MGQRVSAALVDVVFFIAVTLCAKWRIIDGQAVVGLFSSYASARFGIVYGKQQAAATAAASASASQQMRAVRAPVVDDSNDDDSPPPPPPSPPAERLVTDRLTPHRGSGTPPLPRPARPWVPREDPPSGKSRREAVQFMSPLTALFSMFRTR